MRKTLSVVKIEREDMEAALSDSRKELQALELKNKVQTANWHFSNWHFSNFRRKSSALLRFWLQNKFSLKELRWRLIYFFNCLINCKFTLSNRFAIPLSNFNFSIILLHWGNIWKKRYSETYRFVLSRFPWRPLFHDFSCHIWRKFKKCEPNLRIYSYGHCFAHWKPLLNSLLASIAFVDHKFQTNVHESDISCVTSKLKFA